MSKLLQFRQVIGAILLLFGGIVAVGWWTRTGVLVQMIPGAVAMVLNTALCFVLAGAALLMQGTQGAVSTNGRLAAGAAMLVIAALAGLQNILGVDFGIDQLFVKPWIDDSNPHPGRIAPMTSLGFVLAGAFFLLQQWNKGRSDAHPVLQTLALLVLVLGLVGLTGYSLRLDLLYGWYRFVRMAPHTAVGFILLGIAMWLTWYEALRRSEKYNQRDDQRITAIATIILLTTALIASMAGFVLSAHRTEAALNQNLAAAHANRSQLLNYIIDNTAGQGRALASDPSLLAEYAGGTGASSAAGKRELAEHLLSAGYSAIVALDAEGKPLLSAGQLLQDALLVLPMHDGARLLWQSEPVLEVRVPVQRAGRQVGTVVAQRRLPDVETLLRDAALLGKSGDIAVCAALSGDAMRCLPTRLNAKGFLNIGRVRDGGPLPMSLALDGRQGLAIARDYRGAQVVAAYGAIGTTGLGLVVKEDGIDLYEPIRTQLETMLVLLLLLVGAGLMLLRWQVTPLITAMLQAKKQARAGEDKIQTVVDNMADGLLTMDEGGLITSVNPAAAAMFGYQAEDIIGESADMLMPESMREPHRVGLQRYVAGGEARIVGRAGVEVVGLRRDGTEFPMQLAVREAQLEGERIFVGILRDSTAQKRALETSSRFNAFLEATPNLVIFAGVRRELLYINSAGRSMLGLSADEDCSTLSLDQFVDEQTQSQPVGQIFPAEAETAWRGEYTLRARSGAAVPLMFTVVRIHGEDNATNSYAMVGVDVSERNRAEEALRKTLDRFKLLSRATNDTVWDWDFGTNEITWNLGIELTFGHAPETVAASADWWVEHIHPDDVGWVVQEVETEIEAGGQYWTGEYRFRRRDGNYAYVHDRGYIIRDEQGSAVRMIGAMMDITVRKQVEERLRQLEQRFSKIFSMSPVAISVSRLADGEVLEVNEAFTRMFGDGQAQRNVHATLLRNADRSGDDPRGLAERIMDADAISDVETQLTTSNGDVINVLFSAEVIELEGEQHLLCLYNDITERKRAEQALRLSEEKFRSIVETTKDWVWSTDMEDRLVYSNPAVAGMLGYETDELIGGLVLEHLHPHERERVWSEVRQLRDRAEGWTDWLTRWRHKDGSDRYLKSSAVPVFDADGKMTGYRGTNHDLTAIKIFEIELRDAKVRAEQANLAKSEFLANMSHEIRTPMNGVIGLTNLVLRTELSEQQQEYMELIRSSADSLLRLLNDILDFSKMEAKKLQLELVEFDLREELGNVLRALAASATAGDKDLELALDVGAGVPTLLVGDNGRLAQVLINLTSNAIKFTRHGEVVLRVTQQSQADGYTLLHFAVSDTGIGISKEQQAHIFDSFVQADASTTRQYGGTGLGLAIVSQIVELMEGKLWVESEPGVGTTFHFTAPLRLSQRQSVPDQAAASSLKGKRVLVADDNPTTRAILGTILRSWDMYPVLAQNAAHAIAEMQRSASVGEPYPVMLCDSRLHGRTVLDVRRAMQAGGAMIVLRSARDAAADVDALRAAGVAEFLHKPVKHSELFVALMKVLRTEVKEEEGGRDQVLASAPSGPQAPKALRVLVAEDHPINELLVTELLRGRGHFFAVARNGLEVLRMMERQVFDAILMDGQMPDMDGYQATAEIRRREQASGGHIHIVAVTAHAMKDDREACIAAGMDDYIAKPIDPEQLFATLEKPWLAPVTQEAAAEVPEQPAGPAPAFDVEAALKRTRGKKSLLLQMASAFVADAPRALEELRAVAAGADPAAIERSAHRMKGAAATLSGETVVQAAINVERLARTPALQPESMQVAVRELEDRVAALSEALSDFLSRERA